MMLTVVVPIYNVENYLDECITSLISQTVAFDEIILINDGSTDGSGKICEKYSSQYSNITYIFQDNRGLGAARNAGLENLSADYVIFVDSDDYIRKDASAIIRKVLYAKNKKVFHNKDVRVRQGMDCQKMEELDTLDVLYYNASMQYDMKTAEKPMIHPKELDFFDMTGKDYLYKAFPEGYSASACLAAYRTSFLKRNNISFSEGICFEDNLFSLQVALNAKKVCCIPDKLYIRRCRADSIMTGEVSIKKCEDMLYVQRFMWKHLKRKEIDLENADFVSKFVFAGMLYAIGYLGGADDEVFREKCIKRLICDFFDIWMSLFCVKKWSLDYSSTYLAILSEIEKWNDGNQKAFIDRFWNSESQYLAMKEECVKQLRESIFSKMKKLQLHRKDYKVGIYGIGKHTEAFLNIYEKLVGDILCDLSFIVSTKSGDELLNHPIIDVSECKGQIDEVIVSSKLYQQEMRENLMKAGMDEKDVILLYQRGDIYDLIIINDVLNL